MSWDSNSILSSSLLVTLLDFPFSVVTSLGFLFSFSHLTHSFFHQASARRRRGGKPIARNWHSLITMIYYCSVYLRSVGLAQKSRMLQICGLSFLHFFLSLFVLMWSLPSGHHVNMNLHWVITALCTIQAQKKVWLHFGDTTSLSSACMIALLEMMAENFMVFCTGSFSIQQRD